MKQTRDTSLRKLPTWMGLRAARKKTLSYEEATGRDSIDTIEEFYEQRGTGAYVCIWPDCGFARHDVRQMWNHVHFARKHHGG